MFARLGQPMTRIETRDNGLYRLRFPTLARLRTLHTMLLGEALVLDVHAPATSLPLSWSATASNIDQYRTGNRNLPIDGETADLTTWATLELWQQGDRE